MATTTAGQSLRTERAVNRGIYWAVGIAIVLAVLVALVLRDRAAYRDSATTAPVVTEPAATDSSLTAPAMNAPVGQDVDTTNMQGTTIQDSNIMEPRTTDQGTVGPGVESAPSDSTTVNPNL